MDNDHLINELMDAFIQIKGKPFHKLSQCEGLSHNEKLMLFLIHDMTLDNKVSLSQIRHKINLAPSTVTPIITSLESKGLVKRIIDEKDRRNIFLKLSGKGIEYTNMAHEKMKENLKEYIEYMGELDTKELIKLLRKTVNFIEERKIDK